VSKQGLTAPSRLNDSVPSEFASIAPNLPIEIPALSGLRGVSVALVLIAHAAATNGVPKFFDQPIFTSLGNIGVRIFFIISGFLITTLLLRELEKTNSISIRNFYVRRSIRILPAFLVYVFVMWVLHQINVVDLSFQMVTREVGESANWHTLRALTFTYNYVLDYTWSFDHIWSLSVEEQFYLLWPLTIAFVGVRRAPYFLTGVVIAAPIIRFVSLYFFEYKHIELSREFQCVMDGLAMGCLSSLMFNRLSNNKMLEGWIKDHGIWSGALLISVSYLVAFKSKDVAYILGPTFANFGIALAIQSCVRFPDQGMASILKLKPLLWLGLLSYSLYLWQQPFLYFLSTHPINSFPLNILGSFSIALLSYFLIEKPALRLRSRFSSLK
jgi:peptidoglycan/LPS O-acetylase OafA/YrhL